MLEEKQRQFWNLHRIPNKTSHPDFRFFLLFCYFFQFFSGLKISNCNFIRNLQSSKKIRRKSGYEVLFGIRCRFQNCLCFSSSLDSFWLIFFWRFKNAFYRRDKYVYICIYWVLLGGFDAINASNQRTICYCMIFQPSCFIFSINSIVFYEIFYNDVTASRICSPILIKFVQHM